MEQSCAHTWVESRALTSSIRTQWRDYKTTTTDISSLRARDGCEEIGILYWIILCPGISTSVAVEVLKFVQILTTGRFAFSRNPDTQDRTQNPLHPRRRLFFS